jgi:ribosomal protein L11 methyltransferase
VRTWPALELGGLKPAAADEPDLLQAALTDYRIAAIDESATDQWRVYFSTHAERDRAAGDLTRQFPYLALHPLDVPDEDWVARSQAGLRAIRVADLVIAPPWDMPGGDALQTEPASARPHHHQVPLVIVIRPSMGFGTGHHATTRLCLAALQQLDLQGASVVDVGTGSGVLAIAASRLGASRVVGIDDDPDALEAAADNVVLNHAAEVALTPGDLRAISPGTFDVVTANLTGGLLIDAADHIRDLATSGGRMILSGFLRQEEAEVMAAYAACIPVSRTEEEEWVCISLQRP